MKITNQLSLSRPDAQIPLHCGTPASYPGGDRQALLTLPDRPQPAFTDRRIHTSGELLAGFGQGLPASTLQPGHDQEYFDATLAASNLPDLDLQQMFRQHGQRRHPCQQQQQRRQQQQQPQQRPPIMRNGNNLCYAVSAFHLLEHVKVADGLILYFATIYSC